MGLFVVIVLADLLGSSLLDSCGEVIAARALVLVVGILVALAPLLHWLVRRGSVDVHAEGLIVRRSRHEGRVAFDDVDLLFRSRDGIAAVTHDGDRISFPRTSDDAALWDVLRARCSLPYVEPARIALRDGETLTFGPLVVGPRGVRVGERTLPWSSIRSVRFDATRVTVHPDTLAPPLRALLTHIPHPDVLSAVLADRTSVTGR